MFQGNSASVTSLTSRWLVKLLAMLCTLSFIPTALALELDRGPYLQQPTDNSIIVRWRTDSNIQGVVRYGVSPTSLNQTVTSPVDTTEHVVLINGLNPETKYYYSIGSAIETLVGGSADYFFETSPVAGTVKPTRLWVLGDSGTANSDAAAVRNAYLNHVGSSQADMLLMLGDNAYNSGTDSEYQNAVFDMYPTILRNTPVWSTLGNHDGYSTDSNTESGPYYDIFSFPRAGEVGGVASGTEAYYSFDYGNIHFISLDSYDTNRSSSGAMATWLQQDLANTTQDWIIAIWHHPPYTKGSHDSDSESQLIDMRQNFLPILENYGVDLVLTGHSHSYERSYLLDGHYGNSGSLTGIMILDAGDGSETGDGVYTKFANTPRDGAVYAVAGSSGKISGGSLDHPAMYRSLNNLGSMLIDIDGNRLDAVFLRENGSTPDSFTLIKGADTIPPSLNAASGEAETTVDVVFSEAVEQISSENISNYGIDNGISISAAALQNDGRTVRLTTSSLTQNQTYTLSVSAVGDLNSNQMVPEQTTFQWLNSQQIAFQQGRFPTTGYVGTTDAYIAEGNSNGNYGSSATLLLDGDDGGGDDLASLIRWDISAVPPGSVIDQVSLTLQVFDPGSSPYEIYALTRSWNEAQVSWNQADNASSWQSPGADGAGDRDGHVLGQVNASVSGLFTGSFNTEGLSRVQQWVNDPSSNHGVIIANSANTNGIDFYSSETGDTIQRPKLVLTYHAGIVDNTAPSVPANLNVTSVTTSSVSLNWNASSDNVAVQSYRIYRDGAQVDTSSDTSYVDIGLTAGTTYLYQVSAVDASGNESARGDSINVSTDSVPPDLISILDEIYKADRDELKIRATSSEQPAAVLSVYGPGNSLLGEMTFKKDKYELKLRPTPDPTPWEVTIMSSHGGVLTIPITGAPPPPTPGQAHNPEPADGATFVSPGLSLNWSDGGNTDDFLVHFGTAPNPPQVSIQQDSGYTPPDLLGDDTTYYWRIDAVNANGTTVGQEWTFTTAPPPGPPGPAGNPSPANGASNVSVNTQLSWDPGYDADEYDLYFGPAPTPVYIATQVGTSFNPGQLANETSYVWRVDAVNTLGTTAGQAWRFDTQPSVPADIVAIGKAEWKRDRQELKVEATSSAQPGAVLTLQDFGVMNYRKNKYEYRTKPVSNPLTVTVTSSLGGSASLNVKTR